MYLSYTFPRLSASSWLIISPQYSEINSFLLPCSLMNMPHPATSLGACNKCFFSPLCIHTFLQGGTVSKGAPAPQFLHKSGSHSLSAMKQGHCLVRQNDLQRQPGNLF
eukprot:TRINITY_DN9113_c0_g1_i2.p1 TRINITY_DN9113_c0_g1~~TRINITY_DN9113_c0_g1_i2.p1  ORF type:complete len:108 (+),score=9.53 TRINITY_DN9113_c0_g1_i2:194-517(+)